MVALNLLVKPFAIFGIDATVQNRVGADEYGLYFSLLNLSFMFNIIMDLGINNFTVKNIAQYPQIVSRYMGKLLSFRLLLFFIYVIITFTLGAIIGYGEREFYLLIFLVINQFFVTAIAYFRSHFTGLLFFKTEALISILDRLLLILFCGILLLSRTDFKIEWFIWIQTACYGITAIIAFILILVQIGKPNYSWNYVFSLAVVKKSIPFAVLVLLMMIYTRSDAVILERLHPQGKHEAGIYAQGFRLLDAFFLFGMIFSNLLFPMFAKLLKKKESVLPLLRTGGNLLIGGAMLMIGFCYTNSEFIVKLIYHTNVKESIPSFQWLMLSFIGMCFSLIFGTLLTAHGSLVTLIRYSTFAIVVNLSVNFTLIPSLGAEGAAIAAFSTQTFVALLQFFYTARLFDFEFSVKMVNRYILYTISIFAIFFFLQTKKVNYVHLVIELVLGIIAMFATKMVHIKALRKQFRIEDV